MSATTEDGVRLWAGSPVRALFVLLAVTLLVMTWSTFPGVRDRPGLVPLYDDWVQTLGYALAAAAVLWRLAVSRDRRLLWGLLAASLVLRTAGFAWTIWVLERAPVYPSLADAFWVASSLALLGALVIKTRQYAPVRSRVLVLDALLGGLTAGAVAWTFLEPTMAAHSPPGVRVEVVVTNLTYPLLDVALLVLVVAIVGETHGRLSRSTAVLLLGVLLFAVVDATFLYQVAVGSFRPGTFLTPLSMLGAALVAVASWLSVRAHRVPVSVGAASLLTPALLALTCVVVLTVDAVRAVPTVAVVLASSGIVVGILRGYVTLTGDRADTRVVIAAKDEELVRFRALVEASSDFIAIGSLQGEIAYLNPAGRAMIGLDAGQDITGMRIADTLHEADYRRAVEVERPQIMARGSWRGESTLRHQNGGRDVPVMKNTFLVRHPETGEPWLLSTIQRDMSELRRTQDELRRIADQRQQLLEHLTEAEEAERARIAADVHDDSVQALAAVDLQLGLLHRRVHGRDGQVDETLAVLRESVSHATERLRHLLFDLDSPAERDDLVTVLEDAAAYLFSRGPRWRVEAEDGVDLPRAQRVVAYRMAKEAMVNVGKHARADHVVIAIRRLADGVEVAVTDDGIGIPPGEPRHQPGHRGLADMRDRALVAGGWVRVERARPTGTTVRIWMPSGTTG